MISISSHYIYYVIIRMTIPTYSLCHVFFHFLIRKIILPVSPCVKPVADISDDNTLYENSTEVKQGSRAITYW